MSDRNKLIGDFREITGASEEDAMFFLQSADWSLQTALSSFYENFQDQDDSRPRRGLSREEATTHVIEDDDDDVEEIMQVMEMSSAGATKSTTQPEAKTTAPQSRIGTMASIRRRHSSDEEEGQAFYAGGSERSGQQVLGPPRMRNDDLVAEMFRSVRAHGGTEVPFSDRRSSKRERFSGVGYRLGQTSQDTEVVGRPGTSSGDRGNAREVSLKLWKLGFTVDDGPLQSYTDPANIQFLDAIRKGQVPHELIADTPEVGPIHLNMEDRRSEDYNASLSKPRLRAFTGKGHLLGSPTPQLLPSTEELLSAGGFLATPEGSKEKPSEIKVDSTQPTTTIRVRLFDSSVINLTLNHSHTLRDLRNLIIRERPDYSATQFSLMLSYPSRLLSDENASLADAGILNACVLLRPPK